jgi:hypothetical protein
MYPGECTLPRILKGNNAQSSLRMEVFWVLANLSGYYPLNIQGVKGTPNKSHLSRWIKLALE